MFALIITIISIINTNAKEIRFCSIGMGTFGTLAAKTAIQEGFKMVAAFTRYSKHTNTVGELLNMTDDESLSFLVSDMNHFEHIIDQTRPDFCIDATNSTLDSVYSHLLRLIRKRIHVLTLAVDSNSNQLRQKILQRLTTQNDVVIISGGFADSILIPVIPSIAASMQSLTEIKIRFVVNLYNDCDRSYLGLTEQDDTNNILSIHWQQAVIESIAEMINNSILEFDLITECIMIDDEGDCKATNVTVTGIANNDVDIIFSVLNGIENEYDNDLECTFYGHPDIEFAIKDVNIFTSTALSLIHRIPMVLNELEPGYYNVGHLPPNMYWNKFHDDHDEATYCYLR